MNYGDGIYGGIFIAALYSEAYFESDIPVIIDKALKSIPAESDYGKNHQGCNHPPSAISGRLGSCVERAGE